MRVDEYQRRAISSDQSRGQDTARYLLLGLGGLASDGGCRVVTVGGSPEALPDELDEIADGHLPSPEAPELIDIANGKDERVTPDGGSAPPRKPKRVKCQ